MREVRTPDASDKAMLIAIIVLLVLSVATALWGNAIHPHEAWLQRPTRADAIAAELVSHGMPTYAPERRGVH